MRKIAVLSFSYLSMLLPGNWGAFDLFSNFARAQDTLGYEIGFNRVNGAEGADVSELINNFTLKGEWLGGTLTVKQNQKHERELWGSTSFAYDFTSQFQASLLAKKNLSKSDYPEEQLANAATFFFNHKTTNLTLGYKYLRQGRPAATFLDKESFARMRRPTTVSNHTFNSEVEQVLSSRIKSNLRMAYTPESIERPANYLIGNKWGMALGDSLFTKLGYALNFEGHQRLKNERGYFRNHMLESEVTIEPVYDLLLSVSYDLIVENERDPRDQGHTRVAVDQYGVGVRYLWNGFLATSLQGAYFVTNTKESGVNVWTGIECTL
ncbi:MAG: hypothetical protein HQK53_20155 [Oligoflexia bacterium]|nr:hypothetical protein [Oligoflexia bacterium]